MKLDPLTSAYLKVINENASNGKVEGQSITVDAILGDKSNAVNVKPKNTGLENADKDLENVEEAPAELQGDNNGALPKEVKKGEKLTLKGEAKNPFDALYNKIISEDSFDFSSVDGVEANDDFGGPEGIGSHGMDEEDEDEIDGEEDEDLFDGDEDEESEEEHEDLETLISQLKELVSKIESHLSTVEDEDEDGEFPEDSREGEDEEEDDIFGDEDEDEDENLSEESVDIEELSDESGLSLTNKSKYKVDGLKDITIKKKKGLTPKGKKPTGTPENFENSSGISKLQAKGSYNVGGVSAGKSIFNQGGSGSED